MLRVLLINMPFGNLRWPHLGLGLLKAALLRRHIPCDVAYFNFDFAELLGREHYQWLADQFAFVLGGERLFAKHYFADKTLPDDENYYRHVLLATDPGMTQADHAAYLDTARHIEPFLDACMTATDWSCYGVVGFTASFQQTMPSLCLARRIKRLRPEIKIVFGGAACEHPMGEELMRQFAEIDSVFVGEADRTFPDSLRQCSGTGRQDPTGGEAAGRETVAERACVGWQSGPVENLDHLPYPDFDDYFTRLERSPLRAEVEPLLFFETSRGCWWGRKCRCAFCGLNGERVGFRKKSPQRVLDELRYLVARHSIRRAAAADNILDPSYFESLLPRLQTAGLDLSLAWEMKTNLTRRQVQALRDAGLGAAQLGIESFSTPILKQIGKGATAMQNLQALRWFAEVKIEVKWNLLYGFPGEDPAEYGKMTALLPSLYHLPPPQIAGRVRVDRYSRYFEDPQGFGIVRLRPALPFHFAYPFPRDVLERLAYYFDYDYGDHRNPVDYVEPLVGAVAAWQDSAGRVSLRLFDRGDGVLILTDTRLGAAEFQRRMTGIERAGYLFCDTARTLPQVIDHLATDRAAPPLTESAVRPMLDGWVAARLMANLDGHYFSLAIRD
jgi:ribosomal peptide maturation radical SAM protein 1